MRRAIRTLGLLALVCVAFLGAARANFINYSTKEINLKIVYFGSQATTAANENLDYIYAKTTPETKGKLYELDSKYGDRTRFFDFVPATLGEIRGFKVRFHLYTVVGVEKHAAARALVLKGVDSIVFVADADPASSGKNAQSLAELKRHLQAHGYDYATTPLVFQVVGMAKPGALSIDEIKQSLAVGDRPIFAADVATGINVFETLKAAAKLALLELKRGAAEKR